MPERTWPSSASSLEAASVAYARIRKSSKGADNLSFRSLRGGDFSHGRAFVLFLGDDGRRGLQYGGHMLDARLL